MQESIHFFNYKDGVPKGFIQLTFRYEESDRVWIGECLELGTTTEADTLDEIRQDLQGAVKLQLVQMDKLGHIGGFLREHNVRVHPITTLSAKKSGTWESIKARRVREPVKA